MQDVLAQLSRMEPARRAEVLARLAADGDHFGVYEVSSAQRRLWLLHQMYPCSAAYNVPCAFRVTGHCDSVALGTALRKLGERHESLRTVFIAVAGEPRQVILPEPMSVLTVEDRLGVPGPQRDALIRKEIDREATAPFDLVTGPLLRTRMVRFDSADALLVLCLHHIVCDGASIRVLLQELSGLYAAARAGKALVLDAPDFQYLDYAAWQNEWLATPQAKRMGDYWSGELAGIPNVLELPLDRPRPLVRQLAGDIERFSWPGDMSRNVEALCHGESATVFMVLTAAYAALLSRHSRQDDIVVGTSVANRSLPETERMVGFLVNTVALRLRVDRAASFLALLRHVRDVVLRAQENWEYPFDAVVDALAMPRSTAHHPVFQAMLNMQDTVTDALALEGARVRPLPVHNHAAKFDLSLDISYSARGIAGSFEYDTALFEPATVRLFAGRLRALLTAALADPHLPLSALPVLADEERALVLGAWNPRPGRGTDSLVHEIAERQADATPEAVAVVCGQDRLTYRELDERANRLAHYLRGAGIGRRDLIGIALERSTGLIVAMQGVLKSGAAYVPLDPGYPADRLAFMTADADLRWVLTDSAFTHRLPAATRRIELDREWPEAIASLPATRPERVAAPDDLAYVIYTSGSTGRPKGAMIPHRGVCNFAEEQARLFGVTAQDSVLQFASFSFDVSVLEITLAFRTGARLVLPPRARLQPGPDLARTLAHHGVTVAFLPQAVLRMAQPEDLAGLSTIIVGGEVCPEESAARWAPGRTFITVYGPTETSVWMTCAQLTGAERPIPIGRLARNTTGYVLDEALEPCPIGVPGELYIGGICTGRGYLARPGLTAERFVPDPFSGARGARLYRSGDIVRWAHDGQLTFERRIDDQIKIRGYRVELGEIQARISEQPSVRAAVVVAREDEPGDIRLAAYIIPDGDSQVDDRELRSALRMTLPDYMIPAAFVPIEAVPRTQNGKLDRGALPAPVICGSGRTAGRDPASGLEQTITEVWQRVLRVADIGVEDNFFDLGGNSLLIAKARAELEEALGRPVTTLSLFRFPTVLSLARYLAGDAGMGGPAASSSSETGAAGAPADGARAPAARAAAIRRTATRGPARRTGGSAR